MERNTFYKETFNKISNERKDRILTVTIAEFAQKGYAAASINTIAKKAGISIGSMYSYFDSKEALFLTMIDKGYEILERAIYDVHAEEGSFWEKMERLFYMTVRYAKEHPDLNKLYLNLSLDEIGPLAQDLTERIERCFLDMYRAMVNQGIASGELRKDLDVDMAIFQIDNVVVMLQFSLSTNYFNQRMKQYLGEEAVLEEKKLCDRMLYLLKKGLT